MFYYEGHTVPMAGHFSCLIWRLNAGREDEEPSSSLLLAVSPCNLAGTPLVQLSQSPGSAVRAVLDSRETRRLWRDGQSLPHPSFRSYSPVSNTFRLIWTWRETLLCLQWATPDSYEGGLADKKALLSSAQFFWVLCNSRVAYRWLVAALSTLTEECWVLSSFIFFFRNDSSC